MSQSDEIASRLESAACVLPHILVKTFSNPNVPPDKFLTLSIFTAVWRTFVFCQRGFKETNLLKPKQLQENRQVWTYVRLSRMRTEHTPAETADGPNVFGVI